MTRDAVTRELASEADGSHHPRRELGSILAHSAMLVREGSLFPPAAAAYCDKHGVPVSEFEAIRSLSERLLRALTAPAGDASAFPDPKRERSHYLALRYAEALVRQEEVLETMGRVDSTSAPLQDQLPDAERARLDEFLLYRNTSGRFETFDSLIDLWERTVIWVEDDGERYTHDEFVDRLHSRDSLEEALAVLSPAVRDDAGSRVPSLDQRFVDGTHPVSSSIRPASPWKRQSWWWFRVPPIMGKHFQIRLEHVAPTAAREALAAQPAPRQPTRRPLPS